MGCLNNVKKNRGFGLGGLSIFKRFKQICKKYYFQLLKRYIWHINLMAFLGNKNMIEFLFMSSMELTLLQHGHKQMHMASNVHI